RQTDRGLDFLDRSVPRIIVARGSPTNPDASRDTAFQRSCALRPRFQTDAARSPSLRRALDGRGRKERAMKPMKYFVDTHDHRSGTFPAGISKPDFVAFFSQYEKAARDEGVVVLRANVG